MDEDRGVPFGSLPPELQEAIATEIRVHGMEVAEARRERARWARQGRWLWGLGTVYNVGCAVWEVARASDVSIALSGVNVVCAVVCAGFGLRAHGAVRHLTWMP